MDNSYEYVSGPVAVVLNDLTYDQALAVLMCVQLGCDPRTRIWYEKVRSLYTEDGGTKMHEVTKTVFIMQATIKIHAEKPVVD